MHRWARGGRLKLDMEVCVGRGAAGSRFTGRGRVGGRGRDEM